MSTDAAQLLAKRSIEKLYGNDRASQGLGIRVSEIRPGFAKVTMTVLGDMLNGHASCHGGLIFSLADSAFAFACNSHGGDNVGAAASIDFLKPGHEGDQLTAVAVERWRSKRTGIYEVTVANQHGEAIAMFRGRSHQVSEHAPELSEQLGVTG